MTTNNSSKKDENPTVVKKQQQASNKDKDGKDGSPFKIEVSMRFLILALIGSIVFGFAGGMAAVHVKELLKADPIDEVKGNTAAEEDLPPIQNASVATSRSTKPKKKTAMSSLPTPLLISGKTLPFSKYKSRHFSSDTVKKRSSLYLQKKAPMSGSPKKQALDTCAELNDGETRCLLGDESVARAEMASTIVEDDDEEHLPAGQHLLVDIENVSAAFLDSEERLAKAMVDSVNESKLTLLSYHCHSMIPAGVSCVGVLLESHISFHTWPAEGVITLDLFTCGSGKLVPVLPILERLFAVPREPQDPGNITDPPNVVWSHKMRGFRSETQKDYLSNDLGSELTNMLPMMKEVASAVTPFQRIDVYDTVRETFLSYDSFKKSQIEDDDSYESQNSELFQPERVIFLDGVMQSTRRGNEAYHEALVHPAMFAHDNPKQVAIIGGGECSTLREVLKHNTVENVKMVEIDEKMVEVSKEHIPSWSDCSDLVGSAEWCGDDDRAELLFTDALAWFKDLSGEERFDVLIMDALDPQDEIPFAEVLYTDPLFVKSLYNSLTDDGLIVLQLGEAPSISSPADTISKSRRRHELIKLLEGAGFQSLHAYIEGHSGFGFPWTYLVAMKDVNTRSNWYKNSAEINLAISQRMLKTQSGSPPLKYFDGSTMQEYQTPSKASEVIYCRREPMPESCGYRNPEKQNSISIDDVEIKAKGDEWGIYTKVDIEKGTRIAEDEVGSLMRFHSTTTETMYSISDVSQSIWSVLNLIEKYGWQSKTKGKGDTYLKSGLRLLCAHGCKGKYNFAQTQGDITEQDHSSSSSVTKEVKFDPTTDRLVPFSTTFKETTLETLKAGEEILCNRLESTIQEEVWRDNAHGLKVVCDSE